jgi:hypothetical protein
MTFTEPLALQTILINIFSGDATYFTAIAIFAIISLSGIFRMSGITLGFLTLTFLLMFSGYVPMSLVVFGAIIGGLLVGYIIPKIISR